MTTTDNTDLIYCVKCKQKTANVDAERVHEERPRRHQGGVRRLRDQEVPDWGVNFNGPGDCGQPELRRPVHQVVSAGETRPRNP